MTHSDTEWHTVTHNDTQWQWQWLLIDNDNDITAILWRLISQSNFEATELILDLGALDTYINAELIGLNHW